MARKLTSDEAEMVCLFAEFGFKKAAIAREYSVHPDTVGKIVNKGSYRTVLRRKDRKLSDDQVRQIRAWAAEGYGEQKIANLLGNVVHKSTVRQIMAGKSYTEVR